MHFDQVPYRIPPHFFDLILAKMKVFAKSIKTLCLQVAKYFHKNLPSFYTEYFGLLDKKRLSISSFVKVFAYFRLRLSLFSHIFASDFTNSLNAQREKHKIKRLEN